MKTVFNDKHVLHHGRGELNDGQIMPCHERPQRAEIIRSAMQNAGIWDAVAPQAHPDTVLEKVHSPEFLGFLQTVWPEWVRTRGMPEAETPDVLPLIWPVRSLRPIRPQHIDGIVSYHALDAGTPITATTWQAVRSGADAALTAQGMVRAPGESVFCLTRPPGHHAAYDVYGGYCYLNNAAIAAQGFRDAGAERVAILDVDYHHGNGTQAIFEARSDVLVVNIHADPAWEFPYFLGYADETGTGAGEGATLNLPLAQGTQWTAYEEALTTALNRIRSFSPDALVLSWGFDTYEKDPISGFRLTREDFARMGEAIARLRLPTVILLEGGYAVEDLGLNVVSGLSGYENA